MHTAPGVDYSQKSVQITYVVPLKFVCLTLPSFASSTDKSSYLSIPVTRPLNLVFGGTLVPVLRSLSNLITYVGSLLFLLSARHNENYIGTACAHGAELPASSCVCLKTILPDLLFDY